MEIKFYRFAKRINSTKIVNVEAVATYNCRLLDESSIEAPRIELNVGNAIRPNFTYAYIQDYERYYFIENWSYYRGIWTVYMAEDTMASFKPEIGNSEEYVLRSASEFDGGIVDLAYPAKTNLTIEQVPFESGSPWKIDSLNNGTFIVGIVGTKTTYYAFSYSGLDLFLNSIFSITYANDLSNNFASLYPNLRYEANPLQFISSIFWFPFQSSRIMNQDNAVSSVRVGFVDVQSPCWLLPDNATWSAGLQINVANHRHPQSATRGRYLNSAPYSSYYLFYPPFGNIQLPSDLVANSNTIAASIDIDLRTGGATLRIIGGGEVITEVHSQIGINYQVSQVVNKGYGIDNLFQAASGIIGSISPASNLSGNTLGIVSSAANAVNVAGIATNVIASATSAIGDFASSQIPRATTIGSNGGIDSLIGQPFVTYEFKSIADEDNEHKGRPLCKKRKINTLSGYILVSDPDIAITGTSNENNTIKAFMANGFYYE